MDSLTSMDDIVELNNIINQLRNQLNNKNKNNNEIIENKNHELIHQIENLHRDLEYAKNQYNHTNGKRIFLDFFQFFVIERVHELEKSYIEQVRLVQILEAEKVEAYNKIDELEGKFQEISMQYHSEMEKVVELQHEKQLTHQKPEKHQDSDSDTMETLISELTDVHQSKTPEISLTDTSALRLAYEMQIKEITATHKKGS